MLSRNLITVICCLTLLPAAEAQISGKSPPAGDSLEIRAYARLSDFISTNVPGPKNSDREKDSISHIGEEHFLYMPLARGVAPEPTQNTSWDKSLPVVYNKEALQGSPFLLPEYVPGAVINEMDTLIDIPNYLYNYDKVSGNLLLKRNQESPIAVNKEQVKYFGLKMDSGGYIFERVSLINQNEFFQVVYKGPQYSFYKMFRCTFIPANQKTNGYLAEGKDFDEYRDFYTYYLVDERRGESLILELSRKSIRKTLSSASAEVEQYMKKHKFETVTEDFVVQLLEKIQGR